MMRFVCSVSWSHNLCTNLVNEYVCDSEQAYTTKEQHCVMATIMILELQMLIFTFTCKASQATCMRTGIQTIIANKNHDVMMQHNNLIGLHNSSCSLYQADVSAVSYIGRRQHDC